MGAEISPLASKQRMLLPSSPCGRKDSQQHLLVLLSPSTGPPHPNTPTNPWDAVLQQLQRQLTVPQSSFIFFYFFFEREKENSD